MNPATDLDLTGRRALVCGASRGIGAAAAHSLAGLGATVFALARNEQALARVLEELPTPARQQHGRIVVDVMQTDALAAAAGSLAAQPGGMQILVNNSGGPPAGTAHEAGVEAYLEAFRQHLVASQTLVQTLLPSMRAADYGRIVNIISTSVREPIPGLGVSNTIRGAMASWSKTLATELAPHGITVNNVLPGYTRTERLAYLFELRAKKAGGTVAEAQDEARAEIPAGRFAEPREIADAVAFLASPVAGYINGINLTVDGGRTRAL